MKIVVQSPLPPATMQGYREANRGLPLPQVAGTARKEKLAIVGSGLSLRSRFHELADFDGEIWAINGAWGWLREHGIEATFFSVDPMPIIAKHSKGATDLVLATQCDPAMVEERRAEGARIRLWDGVNFGLASAHGAVFAAVDCGFKHITLYGCECSFIAGSATHVNDAPLDDTGVVVECNGKDFYTRAAYYGQALVLAELISPFPGVFEERSGGLLGEMVALARQMDSGNIPS